MRRVYRYEEAPLYDVPFVAMVHAYYPGGYVADLPVRRLHAHALLEQMSADRFISLETRALTLDFSLYNVNINTFCVVRLVFEQLETSKLFTSKVIDGSKDDLKKQLANLSLNIS